jgi:hypothetical protein
MPDAPLHSAESGSPDCPHFCRSWGECEEPEECKALNHPDGHPEASPRERFGFGVCVRGDCAEPCGDFGGCKR